MDSINKGFVPIPTSTFNNKNDMYVRGLTNEIIKFKNPELTNNINEINIRPPHGELSLTGEEIKKSNKEIGEGVYLPVVYSYTEDYGLSLFGSYLTSLKKKYILVSHRQKNVGWLRCPTTFYFSAINYRDTEKGKPTGTIFEDLIKCEFNLEPKLNRCNKPVFKGVLEERPQGNSKEPTRRSERLAARGGAVGDTYYISANVLQPSNRYVWLLQTEEQFNNYDYFNNGENTRKDTKNYLAYAIIDGKYNIYSKDNIPQNKFNINNNPWGGGWR